MEVNLVPSCTGEEWTFLKRKSKKILMIMYARSNTVGVSSKPISNYYNNFSAVCTIKSA
jgi:hypothetical protein